MSVDAEIKYVNLGVKNFGIREQFFCSALCLGQKDSLVAVTRALGNLPLLKGPDFRLLSWSSAFSNVMSYPVSHQLVFLLAHTNICTLIPGFS